MKANCMWCGVELEESPTSLGWIHHDEPSKGMCFECIKDLNRTVVEIESIFGQHKKYEGKKDKE